MINSIVTARGTDFVVGGFVPGLTIDVSVASIEPVFSDDANHVAYVVNLSNGSWIEVKDVVEIWREKDS